MASRDLIGLVDWHLLVLFIGLFVVNHAVAAGRPRRAGERGAAGARASTSPTCAGSSPSTAVLSNLVSNVPAVMLLLPHASHPLAGPILALASSTLAGNLLIVGSIANIIVVEQAGALGVRIGWRRHARVGIPVTLATLAIAAVWLWLRAAGTPGLTACPHGPSGARGSAPAGAGRAARRPRTSPAPGTGPTAAP